MTIDVSYYTDFELALMVICGYLGTGAQRRVKLGARYIAVQAIVNTISRGTMPKPKRETGYSKDDFKKALNAVKPTEKEYSNFVEGILKNL